MTEYFELVRGVALSLLSTIVVRIKFRDPIARHRVRTGKEKKKGATPSRSAGRRRNWFLESGRRQPAAMYKADEPSSELKQKQSTGIFLACPSSASLLICEFTLRKRSVHDGKHFRLEQGRA